MAFRVDVLEGGEIQMFRPQPGRDPFVYETGDEEMAVAMFRLWLSEDRAQAKNDRFVSKQEQEAKKAFKQLMEGSPYRDKSRR